MHVAQAPADLAGVRRDGVALSWWRRELSPSIASFMAPQRILMPVQRLFRVRHDQALEPALDAQLERFLDQRWHGFDAWRKDLLSLLALARSLSRGDELRVRLESVCSNGCRLFHSDLVALRMITTYRGPGTEWLPASAVDARAASRLENRHVLDPSAVRRLGTGDVALMKGDRYPGHVGHGLMHRSPPAAPERPRVVLAVDLD
jgi:hypothetical protein